MKKKVLEMIRKVKFLFLNETLTWAQKEKILLTLDIFGMANSAGMRTPYILDNTSQQTWVEGYMNGLDKVEFEIIRGASIPTGTLKKYIAELLVVCDKYIPIDQYPESIDELRQWSNL